MQMSKTLLACGAVAFGLVALKTAAADTATDAKLREALHQKMEEMNKPAAAAQPAAPAAPAPTFEQPAAAPVVVTQEGAVAPPAAQDDARTAQLRAALREALVSTPPPAESAPATSGTAALPAEVPAPAIMMAPPLPISATKEERLETLLQLYKADRITPMEYHERRAKILAE